MKVLFLSVSLMLQILCYASKLQIGKLPNVHHTSSNKEINSLGIYNGKKTSIEKFPYMVSILLDKKYLGSGVILNANWILTTGFNVKWWDQKTLSFRIGSAESEKGGQTCTAAKVVVHEEYTGSWDYDIAVVKLNKPIKLGKNAKPIKLGTKNLKAATKGVIAGWGPASMAETKSTTLLTTEVTVYDRKKCKKTFPSDLTPRLMCTYDTKVGPCASDCGAPLVYKNAVYGLYAGTYNCLDDPALYVNVPTLVDWVKKAVEQ